MYTLFSVAILAFVVVFFLSSKSKSRADRCFCSLLSALLGAFVGAIIGSVIGDYAPMHNVNGGLITLVSVRTTDGVHGAFIWGSGTIQNETTYNFMMRNADGSLTPGSLHANSLVHIVEDASLTNVGYWTTVRREAVPNSWQSKWGMADDTTTVSEVLRVPAGTVVQSFNVK